MSRPHRKRTADSDLKAHFVNVREVLRVTVSMPSDCIPDINPILTYFKVGKLSCELFLAGAARAGGLETVLRMKDRESPQSSRTLSC